MPKSADIESVYYMLSDKCLMTVSVRCKHTQFLAFASCYCHAQHNFCHAERSTLHMYLMVAPFEPPVPSSLLYVPEECHASRTRTGPYEPVKQTDNLD